GSEAVAGVIDLGTVEIFPVFGAMQRGLIDQDTGLILLEAQVITSDLVVPETNEKLSLEKGLSRNIIDLRTFQVLQELKDALQRVEEIRREGRQLLPVVAAIEEGRISESIGLKILEVELVTGGFRAPQGRISMETAMQERLLTPQLYSRLLSHLESSKDLIDPNTAEKISLPELLHRCIVHQETGLRLLPVKQLPGGMVSLKSGRKVGIFHAIQEGLIDRQVTVRLLEAHLFAGGIVDPRTGHRLTVDEAVRHNLIDQDLACTLLIRQLQTGGIIDTVTGERLTIDEAVRKELVAPRIALVVLESLWSFKGLLWPETGEIVPVSDALEQGILSTEMVHKIISKRQLIKAVFIPETTEVLSWKKAVEHGVLERDVAKKLKSTVIPDVMANTQLAGSPGRGRHGQSSSGRSPTGPKEQSDPLLRSDDERLVFHLMTHSYINIHDGQKLLLVDGELNNLTKALIQTQENGSLLEESRGFEETKVDAALEEEPCNGLASQELEFQFAPSKEQSEKVLPPRTALENGEVVIGPESLLVEDAEDIPLVEEQKQVYTQQATIKSEADAKYGREQVDSASKDNHQVTLLMPGHPSDLGSGFKEAKEMIIDTEESKPTTVEGVESVEDQRRESERGAVVVKSEIYVSMGVSGSRGRLEITAERSQGVEEPEPEAEDVREIYLLNEEIIENGVMGGEEIVLSKTGEAEQTERESEATESVLEVEEGEEEEVLGDERVAGTSLPAPAELEGEDALETLLTQLQSGGIVHEQTGKTLLLNEAVACGVVPSHTAVKLMEKTKMFSGFFDSHTCESLTTEDVIEEGLMDEKLLQKVLASDKAISGVLDPGNNFVYSIKDAAAVGLLDKETATRILEGQVVTGGIVDLKRGKKISVTLASNLGLIEPTSQKELVKLEKASKGKGTDEVTREKLLNLQAETSGIVDPRTKQPLTVAQAVEKGLLEKEKAVQLLTKQVADGGIIHHVSGMRLSVNDAMKHGLINQDLCNELTKAESVCLREYVHPVTKEKLPLAQAVSLGLVSLDFQRKVQEIQAGSGSVFDPASGQRLALCRAVEEGLLPQQVMEKVLSSPEMREGIVDPETCTIVPYSEFLKKCKIDIESGQRYLEVHPFSAIKDEAMGQKLRCAEAAQVDSGGMVEGTVSKRLSLRAAVERGLLDEEMAKVIATNQMRTGGIVDASSGKRLTLKEAVENELISQKLAAALQEGQISEEKYGSEVCKGEKSHVFQEKMEISPKKEDVIFSTSAAKKWDGAEHEARSEARSYDVAGGAAAKRSLVTLTEGKAKPQEASEDGVTHQPQEEVGVTPESPSALGMVSLSAETVEVRAVERGMAGRSSQVRAAQGKELGREVDGGMEKVERLGLQEEQLFLDTETLPRTEDSEERRRRKGFVSAEGVVASEEGAVVASEQGEGSLDRVTPTEPVVVGRGKGEVGPGESGEPPGAGMPTKPAGDELAGGKTVGYIEGETLSLGAEGPVGQEKTSETELKPGQKEKSKEKKTKQTGEAREVVKGGIRNGHDASAAFILEERVTQEPTQLEPTGDVSGVVADEPPGELIIREEPQEIQETSAALEPGEETWQEQPAEISPGQGGAPVPPTSQGEAPQERSRQPGPGERGLLLPVIVEGELLETSRESARPAQIMFSKKMCLEHDEKLISYLSMLRDIEMRIKRVQAAEQNLAALHDLLRQAEVLGTELRELSFPVNQELDAVKWIVANPPEEVPEQLLKALEKDAKNLQKSLSSANDVLESRLQNLRGAAETEKAKILAHHETLQGKLQELLSWVSGTAESLDGDDSHPATDASSLSRSLQRYQELKEPLADTKSQLDATAFDIQFLISEHAQDLTPQQSRQLLRLLNELQKAFRDLSERVTARVEVLQVCLQQVEQTDQVKIGSHLLPGCGVCSLKRFPATRT
ncbi:PREDICTED: microtubule-actin cross-linking factor 1, isoforms 1/2/3/5-like, partial [Pterocles gutturalis]|uniref:microtubule-actin cross-linking factor 1, isoforms 1/2/3/5-like n=1 Tax=Pterocles gutturalis TaxID=240206 RepID=UPI000528C931